VTRRIIGAFMVVLSIVVLQWSGSSVNTRSTVDSSAHTHSLRFDAARKPQLPAKKATRSHPRPVPDGYRQNPLHYLSTAPPDSLILLPGIGPVIAERLASARTGKRLFTRWEDLLAVKGIGPKKLERLRSLADGAENSDADPQ